MKPTSPLSAGALAAVAVLAALSLFGGWFILLSNGFHHAPHRYASHTTFVDGLPALIMAAIVFAMAAAAVAALVHEWANVRVWYIVACGSILIPPLLYVALS